MPQPITTIRPPPYTLDFGPGAATKAPKIAALALDAIGQASKAEADFTRFVAPFTHGRAKPVIDYFLSLRSDAPKLAVVEALAAAALTEERFRLFKAISKLYETAIKGRQPLAHWMVVHCAEIPDALGFHDPKDWLKRQALYDPINVRMQEAYLNKDRAAMQQCNEETRQIDVAHLRDIQIYREKDITDVVKLLWQASERLVDFHMVMGWDRVNKPEADRRANELIQRPEIASLIAAQPKPQPDLLKGSAQPGPGTPKQGSDQSPPTPRLKPADGSEK